MKNTLLGVIAVCLFMITLKLYIPEANAEVAGMDWQELERDRDFNSAVKRIATPHVLREVSNRCKANTGGKDTTYNPQIRIYCR